MRIVLFSILPGPGSIIRPPIIIPSASSGPSDPLPPWVIRVVRR